MAHFLRARRDRLQPTTTATPTGRPRRVKGLRRDEVARLAGISVHYYIRLEQGRDRRPSDQVLDALARALQLDSDSAAYMRNLVRNGPRPHAPADEVQRIAPPISVLIDEWPMTAAQLHDRALTVVAANTLARKLSPHFGPGSNLLRALFLERDAHELYRNWPSLTAWAARLARWLLGETGDPALSRLISELCVESGLFSELWAQHDVGYETSGLLVLNHPQVGELDLHFQHLLLPDTGHLLVTYSTGPGSESEARLRLLVSGRDGKSCTKVTPSAEGCMERNE